MLIGKHAQTAVRFRIVVILGALLVGSLSVPVSASEVDDWAKQADKALRGAERLMFSGKNDEAVEQLKTVDALLKKIEAVDAAHAKLKPLRGKYEKLQKDLARRMDKDEPASGSATANRSKGERPAALPRSAQDAMRDVQQARRAIDHAYRMIENSKTTELSKSVEDHYADIENLIPAAETALKKAREEAAEKGVDSHPDLNEAQTYVDAQPDRLSTVRAEMAAFHKEQMAKEASTTAQADKTEAGITDVAQAQEDWRILAGLCKQYQSSFLSESEVKKRGAVIRKSWDEWKKRFEPARDRFRTRYGDSNIDVYDAFENVPKPIGVETDAALVANLAYDINCAEHEKRIADWAASWGKDALHLSSSIELENKEKLELKYLRAEDALNYYRLAKLWNPGGSHDEATKEASAAAAEALPLWKGMLKDLTWPGHNEDYAGPGSPDDVASAALAFLEHHPDWTDPEYDDEHTPYAARVEGKNWEVWKRAPLTKEPTQFSLDMLVAFTGKADPELVYVYHMVFYTAEAAGVKRGLPIKYASSRQYASFRMLKDSVPNPK